jgi:hypothetical protein
MRYAKGSRVITADGDIPLLRQVRNMRFVSHRQLYELLQAEASAPSRSTFNWRVRRLLATGHIYRVEDVSWQGFAVYSITSLGLIQLESQGDFAVALHSRSRHLPHRMQVFHALELNAIRVILVRNRLLAGWQSEVEISSWNMIATAPFQKDYDAIVKVRSGNDMLEFALEYERSLKASSRYARIRAALELERQIPCVLYLTASPDLTVALVYQLTPLSKPLAFATARAFREHLLATPVSVDSSSAMLTLERFLRQAAIACRQFPVDGYLR